MEKTIEFQLDGEILHLTKGQYTNGRTAILVKDADDMPYAKLTQNIPDESIDNDEIIVKDYDENSEVAAAAYKTGIFRDTGRKVKRNWITAPVWKILDMATIDNLPVQ